MPLPAHPVRLGYAPWFPLLAALALPAAAADVHRHVPDGTLTYHVVLTGHGSRTGPEPGESDTTTLERRFDVTVHMHGDVANAEDGPSTPGPALASLAQAAEACGDDQACMMRAAMGAKRQALHHEAGRMIDALGADTAWTHRSGTACHGTAKVAASETHIANVSGEGEVQRVVAHGRVAGQDEVDCRDRHLGYQLVIHHHGGYDLSVPGVEVAAVVTDDHGSPHRATVKIPPMKLHGADSAAADRPQRGHRTFPKLFSESVTPVYANTLDVPVHAEVDWTFVPGDE